MAGKDAGKGKEAKSRYTTRLGDTIGCESLMPENKRVALEPYGENADPFLIKAREEARSVGSPLLECIMSLLRNLS
jgi:hypothetical protein